MLIVEETNYIKNQNKYIIKTINTFNNLEIDDIIVFENNLLNQFLITNIRSKIIKCILLNDNKNILLDREMYNFKNSEGKFIYKIDQNVK